MERWQSSGRRASPQRLRAGGERCFWESEVGNGRCLFPHPLGRHVCRAATHVVRAPERFRALDSLRGICALLVCLFHFPAAGPITLNPLVRESWVFVDFFFVLSGFVISHSYGGKLASHLPLRNFAGLRFLRLYPLHIVMLSLFLVAEIIGFLFLGHFMSRDPFTGPYSLEALFINIFMLQGMGIDRQLSWNHPSWSIGTEFWTYLVFAVGAATLGARLNRAVAGVVIASAVALILVTDRGINVTADFGMVRCLYGFGLGVLGYAFWRQHGAPLDQFGWTQRSLVEALGLVVVGTAIMLFAQGRASLLLPPMFLALVLGFAGEGGAIGRLLRAAPLLFLGTISYGIYMVHIFVQARLEDGLRLLALAGGHNFVQTSAGRSVVGTTAVEGALLTVLMLFLVIIISHFAYVYVEQPGIRLGRRLFGSRSPATT